MFLGQFCFWLISMVYASINNKFPECEAVYTQHGKNSTAVAAKEISCNDAKN